MNINFKMIIILLFVSVQPIAPSTTLFETGVLFGSSEIPTRIFVGYQVSFLSFISELDSPGAVLLN